MEKQIKSQADELLELAKGYGVDLLALRKFAGAYISFIVHPAAILA